MMDSPSSDSYPETLPIFPLTGVLLLPGGRLPLHIFENRYRAMTEDAISSEQLIGIVQPLRADPGDNRGEGEEEEARRPSLYPVGCVGRIRRWERLPDGRYILLLEGEYRFRIGEEMAMHRGYRRVRPDFSQFATDLEDAAQELDPAVLLTALAEFSAANNLELEMEKLDELGGVAILNSLAVALPFQPAEKQALLEAENVEARLAVLLALMKMGVEMHQSGDEARLAN